MSGSNRPNDPEVPSQPYASIRARTDASIAEVGSGRVDLAQAIVSLGRAGERRRGTRAQLIEATDMIAKAIRKELRRGDQVTLKAGEVISAARSTVTLASVRYSAGRVTSGPNRFDVLFRGEEILGLPEDSDGGARLILHDESGQERRPATAETRELFVAELPSVIRAFRELLDSQADRFSEAARKAAKLTPR
jgi:hypothetical protein